MQSDGFTFTVNSTGDAVDAAIGDGVCETATGNGVCTLRAAIAEANAQPADDTIVFDIPESDPGYNGTSWTIGFHVDPPVLGTDLTITGPGANRLTITRAATGNFRIFDVTSAGIVSISGLSITNGQADVGNGGGISNGNGGTLNLTECDVSGNGTIHSGGGIANQAGGIVNVTRCLISYNSAKNGGGIENLGSGTVNVINSTIFGNDSSGGGGIRESGAGPVNVSNSTIAANAGRGLVNAGTGLFAVKSSIVGNNFVGLTSAPGDVFGDFDSAGFNLITDADGSTGFTQPTDLTGTKEQPLFALLGEPADNGGPIMTSQLFPSSPALDKGSSVGLAGGLTTDQRGEGFPRTFDDPNLANAAGGDGTDIGAYEVQSPLISPTPIPARLGNISTRVQVGTGDNVAIAGFIVSTAFPKAVIIRALGPSLGGLGVDGTLSDPTLQLYNSDGEAIASNDNWKDTQEAEIEATGIAPTDLAESAIVAALPTGAYTAVVASATGGEGVGLIEAYDLNTTDTGVLLNISTRGLVGTGENVIIGGVIILGDLAGNVVLRAIGPSLPFDSDVVLDDPTLELHDSNGEILAANDDWKDTQESEIMATGLAPDLAHESAILRLLSPGSYTAIVSGKNGTTGLALVEAYRIP